MHVNYEKYLMLKMGYSCSENKTEISVCINILQQGLLELCRLLAASGGFDSWKHLKEQIILTISDTTTPVSQPPHLSNIAQEVHLLSEDCQPPCHRNKLEIQNLGVIQDLPALIQILASLSLLKCVWL